MRSPRKFLIAIPRSDGGVELHPMKEWLRQHPDALPELDAKTITAGRTSRQIRDALKKKGWSQTITDTQEILSAPGTETASIEETLGDTSDGEGDDAPEATFALEYQLRDFIAQNLPSIDVGGRALRLYVDPNGREGIEYPTDVGPIDILAVDANDCFVVFELKRAASPDRAVGQLARYMGWVRTHLATDKQVLGAIVARDITATTRYAVSIIPNVSLFEYRVAFNLIPSNELLRTR